MNRFKRRHKNHSKHGYSKRVKPKRSKRIHKYSVSRGGIRL